MDQPQKPSQTAAAAAGAAAYQTPAPEEASGKSTKGSFVHFLQFQFGNFRRHYFTQGDQMFVKNFAKCLGKVGKIVAKSKKPKCVRQSFTNERK